MKEATRKIVVINQAANYLTVSICNEFQKRFQSVVLITGSIHEQGEKLNESIEVTYINKWKEEHGIGKILIYIRALFSFFILLLTKYRKHEVFFISVPPMAYLLNIILPNRFSMLIWDVYPDGLKITGMRESHIIYRTWSWLNKVSFKKAYKIITIGERMADLLSVYVDRNKLIIQPIWSIFQDENKIDRKNNKFIEDQNIEDKFVVQYSGNIGVTHNVETLVEIAERMQAYDSILFQIIGRGPRKKHLQNLVEQKKMKNCQFLPFQSDEMFPFSLAAANLGVVILDSLTAKGSVPSKSYNIMSYGIPSLYIASEDSELNNYVNMFGHGKCFEKNDINYIIEYILKVYKDEKFRQELSMNAIKASKNFKRKNAEKMINYYLN